ncbi:MAG: hypothetical protein E5Y88_09120 [Mesorhizobium sp.]|uniref:hypothetical protein n=1 Tax=unclassified Mesorhizobium TaxID=325217 RepID=UPI000FD39E08|nr:MULTISPECIES: hypothetical protein [unclassified Mesorhizobium]RUU27868.1 hypothetical protein EOC94_19995 [Mesorhizobium sp. M6A.T.Ce.TU.016.01.1.1]RWN69076.1 MAG: hypothetical protein EOR99_03815 [Mesorhizobium sp.]RWQ39658.1 MAG: hypothetical protein EOS21_17235 [Mesorhizobium sp.]RWQ40822.1 MAG: hypothetical protein EOS20_01975 [Mesorhizobium sp.]TIL25972.1 MAG: hypothetical protein E5Y88_09120 [Mesorhizobium sp.]
MPEAAKYQMEIFDHVREVVSAKRWVSAKKTTSGFAGELSSHVFNCNEKFPALALALYWMRVAAAVRRFSMLDEAREAK